MYDHTSGTIEMLAEAKVEAARWGAYEGQLYTYIGLIPAWATGHEYKVEEVILDVPVNSFKLLIRSLSGPDKGLGFTITLCNFATRYKPVESRDGEADQTRKQGTGGTAEPDPAPVTEPTAKRIAGKAYR